MLSINVDFVLLSGGPVWVSYNPDNKEATNLPIRKYWHQIFRYTESLVTIPGSKEAKLNALQGEDKDEYQSKDEDQVKDEDKDEYQVEDEEDK